MPPTVTLDLPPAVDAAARLVGLVGDDGIEAAFFDHPVATLEGTPGRLGELTKLLAHVLGDAEPTPPDIPGSDGNPLDLAWYHLPNLGLGVPTVVHVVAPPAGATTGQIGAGVYAATQLGPATIEAHAYVPVVDLDGNFLLAGPHAQPCHIGLSATSSGRFAITNGVSFKALEIDVHLALDGSAPAGSVTFTDPQDTGGKPTRYTRFADLLDETVLEWLGAVIVQGATPWLQQYPGNAPGRKLPPPDSIDQDTKWPLTIGDILVAAGFLTAQKPTSPDDDTPPYALDLKNLQGTPTQIAENLAFAVLDGLAATDDPLVSLPGGGLYVEHRTDTNQYGMRVAAKIDLGDEVELCLGEWFTGEDDAGNWMTRSLKGTPADRGLSVLLLSHETGKDPAFAPGFSLTSVGLNLHGAQNAPLVDTKGGTLGGVEVRASLDEHDWQWGFGIRLDDVGFPLGPGFSAAQSSGGNAVARTLVASDDKGDPPGPGGSPHAVNPQFSAEAAYVVKGTPVLEIFDPAGAKTDLIWFPIQRRFGPLNCEKVGLRVDVDPADPVLGVVFDGGVELGPLDVELDQLGLGVHLREATDLAGYDIDLQGLAISFASGGVDISGGLVKSVDGDVVSYNGEALIKAEDLAIAALGSFASVPGGGTSLFVFAWLNAPIGGPPFFVVTGLSAGFGYNRALKIPAQSDVQSFPFVAGLSDQSQIGAPRPPSGQPSAPQPPPTPGTVIQKLGTLAPVELGEYWLAAGIQFTTFEIIKTNALLVVEFGHDLVIAVLGISTLKQPADGEPIIYAELDLEVVFRPDEGSMLAAAVLAPGSYLLTPDAHLTGGFAFASWWGGNEHRGDFVFTVGGYHPAFDKPDWYPAEPRVGIDWPVGGGIEVSGSVYFAITPAAMMGGTDIAVTFSAGPLSAWLKFDADVMIRWKPFYMVANASISIGVSFHLHVLFVDVTLSIEIGADFSLYGPPFGFSVHVDWYIVSFTIKGGADPGGDDAIDWPAFKGLLPSKTQVTAPPPPQQQHAGLSAVPAAAMAAPPHTATTPSYVHVTAAGGLLRSSVIDGVSHWLVRPAQFAVTVRSDIPAADVKVTDVHGVDQEVGQTTKVGMRALGVDTTAFQSTMTITVLEFPEDTPVADQLKSVATATLPANTRPATGVKTGFTEWAASPLSHDVPKAMWGDPLDPATSPPVTKPGGQTVVAQVGATLTPLVEPITDCTPQMIILKVFSDVPVDTTAMAISPRDAATHAPPVAASTFTDLAQVDARPGPGAQREALFAALRDLGIDASTDGGLGPMQTTPGLDFADEPMEVAT